MVVDVKHVSAVNNNRALGRMVSVDGDFLVVLGNA
jgi:hypothetical protein